MSGEPGWQGKPEHPFREAIKLLAGGVEPPDYVQGYGEKPEDVEAGKSMDLQGWMREHCPLEWSTGIGLIEAAEHIVKEAVANANIPPEDSEWRTLGRKMRPVRYSTTHRFRKDLVKLASALRGAHDDLRTIGDGPYLDEDYKVKRAEITPDLLAEAYRYVERIQEIVDQLGEKAKKR